MRGDINNFKGRIGDVMQKTLKSYSPEIEFSLGPAKVVLRARSNETLINNEQNEER